MPSLFDEQKAGCLAAVDLSRKGSVDEAIESLIEFTNKHKDFFSLSSCSGRIVILREANVEKGVKKAGCDWILVSHTEQDPAQVFQTFSSRSLGPGCVVLKFEPFVLHVQCRDLVAAKKLHVAASEAGFRNSGISVGGKGKNFGVEGGKIVAAIRSTHGLEVPLTDEEGEALVDENYIKFVVKKANAKLNENFLKIKKFEEKFKSYVESGPKIWEKRKRPETCDQDKVVSDKQEAGEDLDIFESTIFENGS